MELHLLICNAATQFSTKFDNKIIMGKAVIYSQSIVQFFNIWMPYQWKQFSQRRSFSIITKFKHIVVLLMKIIFLICNSALLYIQYKAWQRFVQGHSFILRPTVHLYNEEGKYCNLFQGSKGIRKQPIKGCTLIMKNYPFSRLK